MCKFYLPIQIFLSIFCAKTAIYPSKLLDMDTVLSSTVPWEDWGRLYCIYGSWTKKTWITTWTKPYGSVNTEVEVDFFSKVWQFWNSSKSKCDWKVNTWFGVFPTRVEGTIPWAPRAWVVRKTWLLEHVSPRIHASYMAARDRTTDVVR